MFLHCGFLECRLVHAPQVVAGSVQLGTDPSNTSALYMFRNILQILSSLSFPNCGMNVWLACPCPFAYHCKLMQLTCPAEVRALPLADPLPLAAVLAPGAATLPMDVLGLAAALPLPLPCNTQATNATETHEMVGYSIHMQDFHVAKHKGGNLVLQVVAALAPGAATLPVRPMA